MERSNRNEICHGSINKNESAVETTSEMDEGSRLEMKGNKIHKQHRNWNEICGKRNEMKLLMDAAAEI